MFPTPLLHQAVLVKKTPLKSRYKILWSSRTISISQHGRENKKSVRPKIVIIFQKRRAAFGGVRGRGGAAGGRH